MHTLLKTATLTISIQLLSGCALAESAAMGPVRMVLGDRNRVEESIKPDPAPPTSRSLRQGLANPSFEEGSPSIFPPGWSNRLFPRTIADSDAPDGNNVAVVNSDHDYRQSVAMDLDPWTTVTVGCMTKSQLGFELPRLNLNSGRTRSVTRSTAPSSIIYEPFYGSFTRRAGSNETQFTLEIDSRVFSDWIFADDFFLLFEDPSNGDFESNDGVINGRGGWQLSEGAFLQESTIGFGSGGVLQLQPEATASQLVAHTPFVANYFITGTASGTIVIEEERLATTGATDTLTSATITPDLTGRFFFQPEKSNEGEAALLRLWNHGSQPVEVDSISRGWTSLWPKTLRIAENSPSPSIRLAASWKGSLDQATVIIRDSDGAEVDRIENLQREGDSVWIDYEGLSLSDGLYTASFQLTNGDDHHIEIAEPFQIVTYDPFPESPSAISFDDYMRQAWFWFGGTSQDANLSTVEEYRVRLQLMKDDGFNQVLATLNEDQFQLFKDAAEIVGIPYVVQNDPLRGSLNIDVGQMTYDISLYLEELEKLDLFNESELFQGVYVYDEPNVSGRNDLVREAMVFMEQDERFPPGYSAQNPNRTIENTLFPIVSSFLYPVRRGTSLFADGFANQVTEAEKGVSYAASIGRQYWLGLQGYAALGLETAQSNPQSSMQCAISLATGSDGYFVFLYSSLNPFIGLRGHLLEPSNRLEGFQDFNGRIDAIWPELRDLPKERLEPHTENVFARFVRRDDTFGYLFLINLDERQTVETDVVTSEVTRLVNIETRYGTERSTTHTVTLEPGAWRVYRLADGADVTDCIGTLLPNPRKLLTPEVITEISPSTSIRSVAINDSGSYIVANDRNDRIVYTRDGTEILREYNNSTDGAVNFLDDDTFYAGSVRYSNVVRDINPDGSIENRIGWVRRTTGGYGLIETPEGRFWHAAGFRGVSLIEPENGYDVVAFYPSENDDFFSVHGPYEDGSIIAVEQVMGLYRMAYNGEEIEAERLTDIGMYHWGKDSPNGRRIAIGQGDRGLGVYNVDTSNGSITPQIVKDPDLIYAEFVAWLSDDVVAVSDAVRSIRVYRVPEGGDWEFLGEWLPDGDATGIWAMDGTGNGELIVSLGTVRMLLADFSKVIGDGTSWYLY